VRWPCFNSRQTSSPLFCGQHQSSTIKSGNFNCACRNPSGPSNEAITQTLLSSSCSSRLQPGALVLDDQDLLLRHLKDSGGEAGVPFASTLVLAISRYHTGGMFD